MLNFVLMKDNPILGTLFKSTFSLTTRLFTVQPVRHHSEGQDIVKFTVAFIGIDVALVFIAGIIALRIIMEKEV